MATTTVNDDAIWVKNIEGDAALRDRISRMRPGDTLMLEVDGTVGPWERMRDGRDGRPTLGIKPIAEMRNVWARLARQRGRVVELRPVVGVDNYLASLVPLLSLKFAALNRRKLNLLNRLSRKSLLESVHVAAHFDLHTSANL